MCIHVCDINSVALSPVNIGRWQRMNGGIGKDKSEIVTGLIALLLTNEKTCCVQDCTQHFIQFREIQKLHRETDHNKL